MPTSTLKEILEKYLQAPDINNALDYINKSKIDVTQLDSSVVEFIDKLNAGQSIPDQDFLDFVTKLQTLEDETKNCLIHLLHCISYYCYDPLAVELDEIVKKIDDSVQNNQPILEEKAERSGEKYISILNCYRLFSKFLAINEGNEQNLYPGGIDRDIVKYKIPLALNALRLVGNLPIVNNYWGCDLSVPFYPLGDTLLTKDKVPLKKGIKEADAYYPYKRINKIFKGGTGNNTIIALKHLKDNNSPAKIIFIRNVDNYSPAAVLGSKIARLISQKHFSSERLLNNKLAGSRALSGYAISLANLPVSLDNQIEDFKNQKRVIPGSGIIDEVFNFVHDRDLNIENFGLSSADLNDFYAVKIDFDHCSFAPLKEDEYEINPLARKYCPWKKKDENTNSLKKIAVENLSRVTPALSIVPSTPKTKFIDLVDNTPLDSYDKEKLHARLKLSLLPKLLLTKLANKAFPDENEDEKSAVEECVNRTNLALSLFVKDIASIKLCEANPGLLNDCYQEIYAEIQSNHFEEQDRSALLKALNLRVLEVKKDISLRIGKVMDVKLHHPIAERKVGKATLSMALTSLLFAVGVGLILTGVFAPVGASIATVSIGLGIGLTLGTSLLAISMISTHNDRNNRAVIPTKPGNLLPNSTVSNLTAELSRQESLITNNLNSIKIKHNVANVTTTNVTPSESEINAIPNRN